MVKVIEEAEVVTGGAGSEGAGAPAQWTSTNSVTPAVVKAGGGTVAEGGTQVTGSGTLVDAFPVDTGTLVDAFPVDAGTQEASGTPPSGTPCPAEGGTLDFDFLALLAGGGAALEMDTGCSCSSTITGSLSLTGSP